MMHIEVLVLLLAIIILTLLARIFYLVFTIFSENCNLHKEGSFKTIFCIGSGGHTTELLILSQRLDKSKYHPRLYILADNDKSSEVKIHEKEKYAEDYSLHRIPRSRNVNQSFSSSLFSTIYATVMTIPIIYKFQPNLILCNGPGTCIPVCVISFILRCLFIVDCRIVFVESICRVRTLSLTGKILQYFADVIVVQWPQLRDVCYRAKYFGRLV